MLTSLCVAGRDTAYISQHKGKEGAISQRTIEKSSVGDPDPEPDLDPQDPHVFGHAGSGSISQRYGSGSRSFPFLIKVLSGMVAKKILTQNVSKNLNFKTEDIVPAGKL
jgi:hypothetical protein